MISHYTDHHSYTEIKLTSRPMHFFHRLRRQFSKRKLEKFYPHILFTVMFLIVSHWFIGPIIVQSLVQRVQSTSVEYNQDVVSDVQHQTGISFRSTTIVASKKPFATISGLFGFPMLSISTTLVEQFDEKEFEYVLLHEAGHYVRWHSSREVLATVAVFAFALPFFSKRNLWMKEKRQQQKIAVIGGIIAGILLIQVQRMHEYEADMYALMKGTNPQAMISATQKFQAHWDGPSERTPIRWLLYRGIPYGERIKMAERYIYPTPTISPRP